MTEEVREVGGMGEASEMGEAGEAREGRDVRAQEAPGRGESAEVPVPIEEAAEPVAVAGGGEGADEVAELSGVARAADAPDGDAWDGEAGAAAPAAGGMWDDGLIARRAARWGARRGQRQAVRGGGGTGVAESVPGPGGEGADPSEGSTATGVEDGAVEVVEVSGASGGSGAAGASAAEAGAGAAVMAAEEVSGAEARGSAAEAGAGSSGDGAAGPGEGAAGSGGVDFGRRAEARGGAGAEGSPGGDGGGREGGVAEMGADVGSDVAAGVPEPAGGAAAGAGGPGAEVPGDGGAGGGADDGVSAGAVPVDGAGDGSGTGSGGDAFGGGTGGGAGLDDDDFADAGGRGGAYDGDGAVPRAAGRGRGGARAGHGEDAGTPGGFVPRAEGPLRGRLDALRELVGLSRTRLDGRTLAEAGRVLDEAADRQRLSLDHAVVAIAGATGSGKSSLFNALAGAPLSDVGVRRPTTSLPSACAWRGAGDHAPTLLLERLGLPARAARPLRDDLGLRGLVLIDLPDHDSAVEEHRRRVEDLLRRVDAVIWVVDPEKYADAALHERYLQPLAGYAEVMFVVLNQVDRLPANAVGQVLDDLRRLLDEDGLALGEHGEPGACVLSLSALTGEGVGDLRAELVSFIAERRAAESRLTADVDEATARLREVYVGDGGGGGLDERIRAEFEDRLAEAVGAAATGQAAEQLWLRAAEQACGARLVELWRRRRAGTAGGSAAGAADRPAADAGALMPEPRDGERRLVPARAVVEQAVRTVADEAGAGLPAPWAKAVREAGVRGAEGLADGLTRQAPGPGAETAASGGEPTSGGSGAGDAGEAGAAGPGAGDGTGLGPVPRPRWWSVVGAVQRGLLGFQALALLWLVAALFGVAGGPWLLPLGLVAVAAAGGPGLALACRFVARGPARRYGEEAERRLRESAAASGRARVLEPMAAELLRYREVREQYAVASGGSART